MIKSFIIAVVSIVFMMAGWVLVQNWWKRTFPDDVSDEDALAGRSSCSNCGCTTVCDRKAKDLEIKY